MGWNKLMGRLSLVFLLVICIAVGCSSIKNTLKPCMATIDWVDILMINDISYISDGSTKVTSEQLGHHLGDVTYMLNEHACTDHVLTNGDAAFLSVGTVIYELNGYKPEYRVAAGNKIYEVNDNPNASTLGELLDIEGKVAKVSLESGIDGSLIGDFSAEASSAFIQQLLPLEYVSFDEVYKQTKHESGIFLRIHLQDLTSFRMVYYPNANAFHRGAFGTESLQELIMTQRAQIKAAVGL